MKLNPAPLSISLKVRVCDPAGCADAGVTAASNTATADAVGRSVRTMGTP
jgi:hypothetical protein